MRKAPLIVLLFTPAAALADPLAQFGWFAEMVGSCWVGEFPDGKTRHTHCYTGQFDRFIRGTATLASLTGTQWTDRFSGDSVYAWDPKERKIVYYIWGSDGSHGRHVAQYAENELMFPVESRKVPGVIMFRSAWRRIDASSFEVRREVPAREGWKTEFSVIYRKVPPTARDAGQPAGGSAPTAPATAPADPATAP